MGALLTALAPILGDVLKRVIPDSDKSMEIEREVKLALLEHSDSIEALRGKIVLEEARSQHWMTATWRPLLMMVMVLTGSNTWKLIQGGYSTSMVGELLWLERLPSQA